MGGLNNTVLQLRLLKTESEHNISIVSLLLSTHTKVNLQYLTVEIITWLDIFK